MDILKTLGVSSRTLDGRHVLMMDWDSVMEEDAVRACECISTKEGCGPFLFFTSFIKSVGGDLRRFGNFQAYCLAKFSFDDVVRLQTIAKCDPKFIEIPQKSKFHCWVLRFSGKPASSNKGEPVKDSPVFTRVISPNSGLGREISGAHLHFLLSAYPEILEHDCCPKYAVVDDTCKDDVFITEYFTGDVLADRFEEVMGYRPDKI